MQPMISTSPTLRGVLADPSLSLAAKGVLMFVLTQPSDRVVTRAELFGSCPDPMPAIDAATRELVRSAYLASVPPRRRGQRASGGVSLHSHRPPKRMGFTD